MEVIGSGGMMAWRASGAAGAGVPIECSGRDDPAAEVFVFRFCNGIPEDGNVVAVPVPEPPFAGRDITSDNPVSLMKAGAEFRASLIAALAFCGTSTCRYVL